MNNVVVDVRPLRMGGGRQVAHRFLRTLAKTPTKFDYVVLCSAEQAKEIDPGLRLLVDQRHPRIMAGCGYRTTTELRQALRSMNTVLAYTLFGPPRPEFGVPTVAGMAYSNLLYPDLHFWRGNRLDRARHRLIDMGRERSIMTADALVLETDDLKDRAMQRWPNKMYLALPPPKPDSTKTPWRKDVQSTEITLGMLTSGNENKRTWALPAILKELSTLGRPVRAVLTTSIDSAAGREVTQRARALGVDQLITQIGPVPPHDVAEFYSSINILLLLSRLESVSNNFFEAWHYRTPLAVTDAAWSRSIARDAAIFGDPEKPREFALRIANTLCPSTGLEVLKDTGTRRLSAFPTDTNRIAALESFFDQVLEGAIG